MSGKLTRIAFQQLLAEDIAWLEAQPRTLERDHVIAVVRESERYYYEDAQDEAIRAAREKALRPLELHEVGACVRGGGAGKGSRLREVHKKGGGQMSVKATIERVIKSAAVQNALEKAANQILEAARAQARAELEEHFRRVSSPRRAAAVNGVAKKPRRKGPIQLCPVPKCKGRAAPVYGMVCSKHKGVSKKLIAKFREDRRKAK